MIARQEILAAPAVKVESAPAPTLSFVSNATGLESFRCQKLGPGRRYFDTLVLKASYRLGPRVPSERLPLPIVVTDRFWDEQRPHASSVRVAGDVTLAKPGADVILTGHARTGSARERWTTEVVVRRGDRTLASSSLVATGPRRWQRRMVGWSLSAPAPTLEAPIRWELAYGGRYETDAGVELFRPNPAGSGFFDPRREDEPVGPQWEVVGESIGAPNRSYGLAGYGPVSRAWASRLAYAGTRDRAFVERLRREAAMGLPSDYPADLDARFFQCAAPALQTGEHLLPGDVIATRGLMGSDEWNILEVPGSRVFAELHGDGETRVEPLAIDTVHLDLDEGVVSILHRLVVDGALGFTAAAIYPEEVSS